MIRASSVEQLSYVFSQLPEVGPSCLKRISIIIKPKMSACQSNLLLLLWHQF